jgi:cytochrome c biogenesis protein CcdA
LPIAPSSRPSLGYLLLALAVGLVSLAGYGGYVLYPRFDLPAVEGAALFGLAAAAGLGSFFSPCSFPLLVALLGRAPSRDGGRGGARPLRFAAALAAGAATFMLVLGAAFAGLGAGLFADVTFASPQGIALRATVGVLLVVLGLIQSGIVLGRIGAADRLFREPLARRQARLRRDRPVLGHGLFGFGYVLAGFG